MKLAKPLVGFYGIYFILNALVLFVMGTNKPYLEFVLRASSSLPLLFILFRFGSLEDSKVLKATWLIIAVAISQGVVVWPMNDNGLIVAGFFVIIIKVIISAFYRKELEPVIPKSFGEVLLFITPIFCGFLYAVLYLEPLLHNQELVICMLVIFIDMLLLSLVIHYTIIKKTLSYNVLIVVLLIIVSDLLAGLEIVKELFVVDLFWTYVLTIIMRVFLLNSFIVDILGKEMPCKDLIGLNQAAS